MIWLPLLATVAFNITATVPPMCVMEDKIVEKKIMCNVAYRVERLENGEWVFVGQYPAGARTFPQGTYRTVTLS